MTTVAQSIGFIKLPPDQIWMDQEFIKTNLVNDNYGIDELHCRPLVVRSSESFGFNFKDESEKLFLMQLQWVAYIAMRWIEHHDRISNPIILSFTMINENLDYNILCRAYKADWLQ